MLFSKSIGDKQDTIEMMLRLTNMAAALIPMFECLS